MNLKQDTCKTLFCNVFLQLTYNRKLYTGQANSKNVAKQRQICLCSPNHYEANSVRIEYRIPQVERGGN